MVRPLRVHVPGGLYHVTLRGNHRQDIFATPADRALLNAIVAATLEKYSARLHAYCWMSNHLHLIIQVGQAPLGGIMRGIGSGYARAFQRKLQTTGHLFERRYHAILIATDAYLMELVRYVHLNPVRAGIAPSADAYRWSSHHVYQGTRMEPWVTTDLALGVFGSNRAAAVRAYRRFIEAVVDEPARPFDEAMPGTMRTTDQPQFDAKPRVTSTLQPTRGTLDSMLAEACARFQFSAGELGAHCRQPRIARARAWIARRASARGIATLAAVARVLNCDRKSLRNAMEKYPEEGA